VAAASVEAYLAEHGRVDERRATRRRVAHDWSAELESLRGEVAQPRHRAAEESDQYELSRCRAEVTALRAALLELRARQAPLVEASVADHTVIEHLQATIAAQNDMIQNLRRALSLTDAAVGQFVVPGVPED
jgi:hypothetical protein